jgi:hypothetical protein
VTRFIPSRGLLATNLPLFPRRLQLPVPLGLNLLLMPGEHVLRRDVSDGAVQTRRRARSAPGGLSGGSADQRRTKSTIWSRVSRLDFLFQIRDSFLFGLMVGAAGV